MSGLTSLGQGGGNRSRASKGAVAGNILYPGVDYGLPAGFGAGTAAAVNAAMAACAAAGGGDVFLPATDISLDATIDNKYSRVLLLGAGEKASFHDGGSPTWGTRIRPSFAGTVLKHRTPFASELGGTLPARNDGGGFENIIVDGNSIATRLLEVTSVGYGSYDIGLNDCIGTEAALFTCGTTGVDIAESADIQNMRKCNITFRQLLAGAAADCDGVVFSGSANANVSMNFDVHIIGQYLNGKGFRGRHCDNNILSVKAYRAGGGTGHTVYMHGATASLGGGYTNIFTHVSGTGTIYAEGTGDPGVTAGKTNTILNLDTQNGTPEPTAGTGAKWRWQNSQNVRKGGGEIGLVVGNNANQVSNGLAAISSESVHIRNGSQNHVVISDGTNVWGINLDASGNLRLSRGGGTGGISLGSAGIGNYANDAAAAAGGVGVGGIYRNGSVLQIRVS